MSKLNLVYRTLRSKTKHLFKPFLFTSLMLLMPQLYAATDELAGISEPLQATFGPGSMLIKILYLVELIVGIYGFTMSKHPKMLIGIVVISIFVTYALPHFVFPAA